MLCKVDQSGGLTKMQLSEHPECSLFAQQIVHDTIIVQYMTPKNSSLTHQDTLLLELPLEPALDELERTHVNLHQSLVLAYRMGPKYDLWFSACFGFETALVFIGDGRRPVLGTFSPKSQPAPKSWLSSLTTYVSGHNKNGSGEDWLTFTDCAPYLVATEQSLKNVGARFSNCEVEMHAFRPNIVVDGEAEWEEDFWAELAVNHKQCLVLTKNCNRCTSLNVDYNTGRTAEGERGTVLKKLMSDRRVDAGAKHSPVFGRYGFLTTEASDGTVVAVGDPVQVTARRTERAIWDWPLHDPRIARYY